MLDDQLRTTLPPNFGLDAVWPQGTSASWGAGNYADHVALGDLDADMSGTGGAVGAAVRPDDLAFDAAGGFADDPVALSAGGGEGGNPGGAPGTAGGAGGWGWLSGLLAAEADPGGAPEDGAWPASLSEEEQVGCEEQCLTRPSDLLTGPLVLGSSCQQEGRLCGAGVTGAGA
jgi:hypothetical protein